MHRCFPSKNSVLPLVLTVVSSYPSSSYHHCCCLSQIRTIAVPQQRTFVARTVRTLSSHQQDKATNTTMVTRRPAVTASPSCWCCTASVSSSGSSNTAAGQTTIEITRLAGYQKQQKQWPPDSANTTLTMGAVGEAVDQGTGGAVQASDWMQYIEQQQQQQHPTIQEGGAGAYDTLRCDLLLRDHAGQRTAAKWNVWGQEFHLDRLEKSYQSLQQVANATTTVAANHKLDTKLQSSIARARKVSEKMLQALLEEASRADVLKIDSHEDEIDNASCDDGPVIQLVRLTWLWSPPPLETNDDESIVVRGHAVCSSRPVKVFQPVKPIICTIAADHHKHCNKQNECSDSDSDITVDESLPNRWDHPQSKVASWTRLRKKLEAPEAYKPAGVSEVLLVRPSDNGGGVELLEGLSSNLFVLYSDGTLRTASSGVLHGYVRQLVLDCASACNVKVSSQPILLDQVDHFREAFISSSSRLIFPISKMLLHDGENEEGVPVFREFWQDPLLAQKKDSTDAMTNVVDKPKWQQLLDEILRRGGYFDKFCSN